ncbi:hypothetical protein BT67DRAFT_455138 [Trichocladium antarcticum]|uniref:von Willebrand domain-containing protein n=1 Tax=Trichocladium antarcticum TaxID=1450529 RepID=A0AAN6ZFA9_9PEZI|nr:hypothetical protein BT67DRAFT_455138 [Trichocladium antarcticum]
MAYHGHICGLYIALLPGTSTRQYLPQVSVSAHTKIISSTSRTTLTQTFVNPKTEPIAELRYTFPLYDGVSVVGFVCTINGDRVIRGVVKERAEAKTTYQDAIDKGQTAGLLEQLPDASDVFTTTIGNVPAKATLKVDITYLGELKHDAGVDGTRFTIPTHIAPRYGSYPGELLNASALDSRGISIVVDVEMPDGSNIKNVQSPTHPIAVTLGNTSAGAATGAEMSLQKASATLALATAELGDDFVLQVVATNTGNPIAVLETHPTIPNHRALMATLVPRFNLPASRPEVVFVCDRSGSMSGRKTDNLKIALHVFLKSLPVGVKFNICSFGSRHDFLFPDGSKTYDAYSLKTATSYVDTISANYGGTEIFSPMEDVFKKRYSDMDLEVFLLTDGEVWNHAQLFDMINQHVAESKGAIRVFSLGIGRDASHALIEGVATAGNGFAQSVGDKENMNSKVVRMLKASLTPHIMDYTLEVKYHSGRTMETDDDDEFEVIEKVIDALTIDVREPEREKAEPPKKTISLFDPSADPDVEMRDDSLDTSAGGKYSHLQAVSEPKLLQAPFIIPPLYPFSRTSVYLLLSSETRQKQPKSVVLRGTSPIGPVELEIPVTVLSEPAETIHQLAARKAVKELEEGRGWIYHAKNAKGGSRKLLKDQYPGRFPDMVEREAVRLGVTYQVGGKWCSFVAVEANQESSGTVAEPAQPPFDLQRHIASVLPPCQEDSGVGRNRLVRRSIASARSAAPPSAPAAVESSTAPKGRSSLLKIFAAATPPPRPSGLQQKASLLDNAAPQAKKRAATPNPFSLASAAAPPSAPPPLMNARYAAADHDESARGSYAPLTWMRTPAAVPSPPPLDAAALSPADRLAALVMLQSFSGAWAWDGKLLALLGLGDADATLARARAAGVVVGDCGGERDVLATGLVLVFLEVRMAGLREEWEMLAEKAREWLAGESTAAGQRFP